MTEYIDRDILFEQIRLTANRSCLGETSVAEISAMEIVNVIANMPAADVEPVKHGYLIVRTKQKTPLSQAYIRIEKTFECSCCGAVHRRRMNYCGECGAKMDAKEVQE